MKRFWNWKTALAGILTALVLTGASGLAFAAYCHYLHEEADVTVTIETTEEAVEETSTEIVVMRTDGEQSVQLDATPSVETLKRLFGYHFVLYKELCDNQRIRDGQEPYLRYQDMVFGDLPELEFPTAFNAQERASLQEIYEEVTAQGRNNAESMLSKLESTFSGFNDRYDYWIYEKDHPAQALTNAKEPDASRISMEEYAFLFQVDYDEHGVASIPEQNLFSGDKETLRKNVNSVMHKKMSQVLGVDAHYEGYPFLETAVEKALLVKNPKNCSIVIGITWEKYQNNFYVTNARDEWTYYLGRFSGSTVRFFCLVILVLAALSGALWFHPGSEEKRAERSLAKAPLELLVALALLIESGDWALYTWMTGLYLGARIDFAPVCLLTFFICLITWYAGGCLGELRLLGVWGYLKKRCLFVRAILLLIRHCRKVYKEYHELNLGMNLRKKILRLVIYNAILVSVCCCAWFLGIIGILIYSVCLYFLILHYINAVQKDYQKLQRMTMEMSEGNLKYEPEENLGLFEPVKEDLVQIRNGFDKAVREEVKSHKMKTELITNVSHDLKTPLTAIITYVNLLKEKNLTEEQREQYVDTLDKKSLRLKLLIEDLFEVSKANSGNIQLNIRDCDLVNLIKQCYYEVEDKLEERGMAARLSMPEGKILLRLDGEKTYRIYENLLNNVVKYAMPGTRVYVSMVEDGDRVTVTVKNITEAELYVPAEELTERFVRGDASRGSVEGSGLGLAIARSFTELQGGKFDVEVDGDLFKVTTTWKR